MQWQLSAGLCNLLRSVYPRELGSNLLFRINAKTALCSFRAEIRGAQSQQRRDYRRWSNSTVLQRKKKKQNHKIFQHQWGSEGLGATIKETIVCLILAAFRERRLRMVFVNKQDYSKQITGSHTSIYSWQKPAQGPQLQSSLLGSGRRKGVTPLHGKQGELSPVQQGRSLAGDMLRRLRSFSEKKLPVHHPPYPPSEPHAESFPNP